MRQHRIHFVTANYYQLQGLRLIPLGLFLLLLGASARGWLSWLPGESAHARQRWLGVAFCLALIAAVAATAHYRRRYGSVAQFGRAGRNWLIVLAVVAFLALAQLDQRLQAPIALGPLWIGAALALTVWADGWVRAHFLIGAASWLAVSLMPVFHPESAAMLAAYYAAGGLTLLVCGIGDHLLVSHTLLESGTSLDGPHARAL